jgi:cytidylate kinase
MSGEIITITGDLGSGKSAVSHFVAAKYAMRRYSSGEAQRRIAKDLGITTIELNLRAEQDSTIDQKIDAVFGAMADSVEPLVIDSRMAWHFLPRSFKVKLRVFKMVAAQRVLADLQREGERYGSIEEAAAELLRRRLSEVSRFKAKYNVDISAYDPFDLVIDTTLAGPEEVAEKIMDAARAFWAGQSVAKIWASPRLLFPTKNLRDLASVEEASFPIEVIEENGFDFIYRGHQRTSRSLAEQVAFVPLRLLKEGELADSVLIRQYLQDHFSLPSAHEWEKAHHFQFHAYPGSK